MKADDFLTHYRITTTAEPTGPPPDTPTPPRPGHPWWRIGFTHHHTGQPVTMHHHYEGGLHDTLDDDTPAQALYLIAWAANLGTSYEHMLSELGDDCGITRQRWEKGEKITHARCRAWTAHDPAMWNTLLYLRSPDDH